MRIAIFHNLLSGGAKRTLHEVIRRLVGAHEVRVYSVEAANHDFADLRPLVAHHQVFPFRPLSLLKSPLGRLNQWRRLSDLRRMQPLSRQVAAAIEQDGADVAFVHPCQVENSPSVLRYLRRVPSVYYCQEPLRRLYEPAPERPYEQRGRLRQVADRIDPLPGLYHRALKRTDRQNLRQAGTILVNSEYVRQAVKAIYGLEAQVSYLGVDPKHFRPLYLEKQAVLLSVGSLTPLKGFDFLIRAVGRMPASERLPLVIASNFQNPPERDYLATLAQQLSVELRLVGNVDETCLVELYNQALATVYAPWREPFGLVPVESLACGTPVVAVRDGGVPESIIDGEVGLLAERDEGQFARQVAALVTQPAWARALGQNGRQHVLQRWTWDQAVSRIVDRLSAAAQA